MVESARVRLLVRIAKSNQLRHHCLPTVCSIGLGHATTDQKIADLYATTGIGRIGLGAGTRGSGRIGD